MYQHYWLFKQRRPEMEPQYQRALILIQQLIRRVPKVVTHYSDPGIISLYQGVRFNGPHGFQGEDFSLAPTLAKNGDQGFCRTDRMPYDPVVTASLILLQACMEDNLMVGSDGTPDNWKEGLSLARASIGRNHPLKLKIPEHVQYTSFTRKGDRF